MIIMEPLLHFLALSDTSYKRNTFLVHLCCYTCLSKGLIQSADLSQPSLKINLYLAYNSSYEHEDSLNHLAIEKFYNALR